MVIHRGFVAYLSEKGKKATSHNVRAYFSRSIFRALKVSSNIPINLLRLTVNTAERAVLRSRTSPSRHKLKCQSVKMPVKVVGKKSGAARLREEGTL